MTATAVDTALLRTRIIDVLHDLEESIKGQTALLNGCCDADWIDEDARASVRWLLSALREHRRRVRQTARVWRTLAKDDSVHDELVSVTEEILDEHRYFRPYVENWRMATVAGIRSDRQAFWNDVMQLAQANLRCAG